MINFIIIWLLFWLLVIATLQNVFKGESWFIRYLFFIHFPLSLAAMLIALWIIVKVHKTPWRPVFRFLLIWWLIGRNKFVMPNGEKE